MSHDPLVSFASAIADWLVDALGEIPESERLGVLAGALDRVSPTLGPSVFAMAELLERRGQAQRSALRSALTAGLGEAMAEMAARWTGSLGCTRARLGLGDCPIHRDGAYGLGIAPPDVTDFREQDDIVQHNLKPDPPSKKKLPPKKRAKETARIAKQTSEWEARQYRGLWYPGFQVAISSLTPDDIGLATAFLAGKLTPGKCPRSDWAQREMDRKNKHRRRFMVFQKIAGVIATAVMGIIYGPLGSAATRLLHKGKMALIGKVWRQKIVNDPQMKILVDQLNPTGPFTHQGFRYWMRPIGNMLVEELGCRGDLQTRLAMHGRMLRTLDVLAASSPKARSRPGGYDYPSSFGMLRGSIFPPRGFQFDGKPVTPTEEKQIDKIVATPVIQAVLKPTEIPPEAMVASGRVPETPKVVRSAARIRALIAERDDRAIVDARAQLPVASQRKSPAWLPVALIGGAALGVALLASAPKSN